MYIRGREIDKYIQLDGPFCVRYHESWNLPSPPHIVTYAKKMLSGGLFAREGMLPDQVRVVSIIIIFLLKKPDLHGQDGLFFETIKRA